MIDTHALGARLSEIGLEHWIQPLKSLAEQQLCATGHGDYSTWESIVKSLPASNQEERRELLLGLSPWRKGPFELGDIAIDTEWRSDLKWNRIKDAIASLDGRNVLDVGCGNGYYALQMATAGAKKRHRSRPYVIVRHAVSCRESIPAPRKCFRCSSPA